MLEATVDDPEKLETLRADSQGRVSLGVEYAGRTVTVLVVESATDDDRGVQQIIAGEGMADHERTGMLFCKVFGIDPQYVDRESDEADAEIDPATLGHADVDWSEGILIDSGNVARYEFPAAADTEAAHFGDQFSTTAVAVEPDEDSYGKPVYCFENDDGDTSAIDQELVARVRRVFGYDPLENLSLVGLHPDSPDHPVAFGDATGDTRIVVAPRVAE